MKRRFDASWPVIAFELLSSSKMMKLKTPRRELWLPLGIALGCMVVTVQWMWVPPAAPRVVQELSAKQDDLGLRRPSADMEPADVVQLQLASLGDMDRERGIRQCFLFASPANRIVTGPPSRFGRMVMSPPYDVLCQRRTTLVGKTLIVVDYARVLVTVAIDAHEVRVFQFELSRQKTAPYTDCWMTDAVVQVDSTATAKERHDADRADVQI
jgi:hypothetical protein